MLKTLTIISLLGALLMLSLSLMRVENERHALAIGLCELDPAGRTSVVPCTARFEERNSKVSHLYHALFP